MSEKELTIEERLAKQHTEIYKTRHEHFSSLRRILTVALESIDASMAVLEINPDVPKASNDDKP